MTYGRRYLKCLIFNIVLRGDDNDGKTTRLRQDGMAYINASQIAEMRQEIAERNVNLPILLDYYKIEGLDMMPARDFASAMQKIRTKKRPEKAAAQ